MATDYGSASRSRMIGRGIIYASLAGLAAFYLMPLWVMITTSYFDCSSTSARCAAMGCAGSCCNRWRNRDSASASRPDCRASQASCKPGLGDCAACTCGAASCLLGRCVTALTTWVAHRRR